MADVQSKWGTIQKNFDVFGEHPILKISVCHFIVVYILLVFMKPQCITSVESSSHIPAISHLKVIVLASVIVSATLFIPPLLRK